MKTIAFLLILAAAAQAGPRTSASYTIATDTADTGGQRTASASYTNDAAAGRIAGLSTVATDTMKSGYVGQLYEVTGLTLTAAPSTVNEGATFQLAAWQALDDATFLAVPTGGAAWSVQSGPLTGINAGGGATAGTVYQDTAAIAQGSYLGQTGLLELTVRNVNLDDFGTYAADGIDDAWQAQYFGLNNPNAGPAVDFDATGQTNLFKFAAGLNPLNGARFQLTIAAVPGQPGQKMVTFSPFMPGRSYVVQAKSSLSAPTWGAINASAAADNGAERTITDLNAGSGSKFYRVEITKP